MEHVKFTDVVELVDGKERVMRGYSEREFKEGMVFWLWDRESFGVPISRIKSIATAIKG